MCTDKNRTHTSGLEDVHTDYQGILTLAVGPREELPLRHGELSIIDSLCRQVHLDAQVK